MAAEPKCGINPRGAHDGALCVTQLLTNEANAGTLLSQQLHLILHGETAVRVKLITVL